MSGKFSGIFAEALVHHDLFVAFRVVLGAGPDLRAGAVHLLVTAPHGWNAFVTPRIAGRSSG
jgi:hypothetical protein